MSDVMAAFSVLAWSAYIVSRLARERRVPELVVFLAVGAALGPSGFGVVNARTLEQLAGVTQLALAVLMFIVGERVSTRALRTQPSLVFVSVAQFALTAAAVATAVSLAGASRPVSVLLGVLAGAGAPMTVSALSTERRARGPFVDKIIGAHAMSDALSAVTFAAALPVAVMWSRSDADLLGAATSFARVGVGSVALGIGVGLVVGRMSAQIETSGELLLFALVHVLVASTVALALGLSLPLTALIVGATAASATQGEAASRLFVSVRSVEQPLYLLFFGLAGASIHIEALPALGLIGIVYVVARALAKVAAGAVGAAVTGGKAREATRFGTSLIPQAGVAVGLAVLAAEVLPSAGEDVAAVVLGSVVIFELVGPLIVSRHLSKTATADRAEEPPVPTTDRPPSVILFAAPGAVSVPGWVMGMCARSGADLVALGGSLPDDPCVEDLRKTAAAELVDLRWIGYGGESFAAAVTRAAADVGAELVVLEAPIDRGASRLAMLPHERITRQIDCPVLLLPGIGRV